MGELSTQLFGRRGYLYGIKEGSFKPSRQRLTKLAQFFDDEPHILYVLADLESPAPLVKDTKLRELQDIASNLPPAKRIQLLKFAIFLRDQDN